MTDVRSWKSIVHASRYGDGWRGCGGFVTVRSDLSNLRTDYPILLNCLVPPRSDQVLQGDELGIPAQLSAFLAFKYIGPFVPFVWFKRCVFDVGMIAFRAECNRITVVVWFVHFCSVGLEEKGFEELGEFVVSSAACLDNGNCHGCIP